MSDRNSRFSPCHVSPRLTPCRCCSDHRRRIVQLEAELDAERAAAAESIDMIRRLEREKSDAMLEFSQFKKFAEEKMARYRVEIEALEREMRFKREQKENSKKMKAEEHLYRTIKVARDEDLREQIGKEIYFDLVDHDEVCSFRIQKQWPFTAFKEEVAKEFGIPVQFQRYWLWARRQNHTYRPRRPLTAHEELQTVGTLREVKSKTNNAELKLFLEVELGVDLRPLPPPDKSRNDILIFFKLYDPEKEELCYVGRMLVKADEKPIEILAQLNELAGFQAEEEIELYEEIKFEPNIMCEPIDKRLSFENSQLEDGDIICIQKAISSKSKTNYNYPDVPSFLEYVHNLQSEE